MEPYPSFELLLLTVGHPDPITIVLLYRPPDKKHTESFIPQFSDFLATLMQSTDRALLVGDFYVYYDCPSRPIDREFMELINSFGFIQHVKSTTHNEGHTRLGTVFWCHGGHPFQSVRGMYLLSWFKCMIRYLFLGYGTATSPLAKGL